MELLTSAHRYDVSGDRDCCGCGSWADKDMSLLRDLAVHQFPFYGRQGIECRRFAARISPALLGKTMTLRCNSRRELVSSGYDDDLSGISRCRWWQDAEPSL